MLYACVSYGVKYFYVRYLMHVLFFQLLPAVFTCVVGAARGVSSADATPHRWQLREQASRHVFCCLCLQNVYIFNLMFNTCSAMLLGSLQ